MDNKIYIATYLKSTIIVKLKFNIVYVSINSIVWYAHASYMLVNKVID